MNAETPPPSARPEPQNLPLAKSLEELIAEQGVTETATFERLLGRGANLWADDAEFDAFLQHLRAVRHEKG